MNTDKFNRDIERIIGKYYKGDRAGRKRLTTKREEERLFRRKKQSTFSSLLKIAFPRCPVVNWTSISSDTSYKYRVLLNETVESIMDDDIELIKHLGGKRKDLDAYFSYLANYWHWHIIDTSFSDGVWNSQITYGIPDGYARNIEGLRTNIEELGFEELDEATVKRHVREASVPLVERGKATVFNLLFSDTLILLE
jgi:hypothetical protein